MWVRCVLRGEQYDEELCQNCLKYDIDSVVLRDTSRVMIDHEGRWFKRFPSGCWTEIEARLDNLF